MNTEKVQIASKKFKGMSLDAKKEILQSLIKENGEEVIIIDPELEYQHLGDKTNYI